MTARDTARRTRARAFIGQPLKPGRAWSELAYAYDYTPEDAMSYLGWFDDNPTKDATTKVQEAITAYRARFQTDPNVILVNEAERIDIAGVTVRSESYIRRNNYWVGTE